jgi:hypothetical protein
MGDFAAHDEVARDRILGFVGNRSECMPQRVEPKPGPAIEAEPAQEFAEFAGKRAIDRAGMPLVAAAGRAHFSAWVERAGLHADSASAICPDNTG